MFLLAAPPHADRLVHDATAIWAIPYGRVRAPMVHVVAGLRLFDRHGRPSVHAGPWRES